MAYQDIARRQKLPQTSMETYEDNINWLHELLLDEDRIEMIQKMEQLPNVLAMSTPRYKLTQSHTLSLGHCKVGCVFLMVVVFMPSYSDVCLLYTSDAADE